MSSCNIIDSQLAKILLPERKDESNKGSYGKVLNFAGCKEYIGAAYLSSVSALKVGAGYVELASPNCVKDVVATKSPDIVFLDMNTHSYLETLPRGLELDKYSVVSVGCGLGNNKFTQKFVKKLIDYINEHLEEDLSLERLAKLFFASKYHIAHLFKQAAFSLHNRHTCFRSNVSKP